MRRLRWLLRWQNAVVVLSAVLAAIVLITYVDNVQARHAAEKALQAEIDNAAEARRNATTRIDAASSRIETLVTQAQDNASRQAELLSDLAALEEQVRQLGGRPIVVTSSPSTTRPSQPGPTTSPPPSSPPPSSPPPTTPPPDGTCPVNRLGVKVCIPNVR